MVASLGGPAGKEVRVSAGDSLPGYGVVVVKQGDMKDEFVYRPRATERHQEIGPCIGIVGFIHLEDAEYWSRIDLQRFVQVHGT